MFKVEEVLRYLKAKSDDKLMQDILRLKPFMEKSVSKRFITGTFAVNVTGETVYIGDVKIDSSNLAELLQYSNRCIVLAATLGMETDKAIAFQSKVTLTDGLIADSIASAIIEQYCDEIQASFKQNLTMRYSPGYGDFKLEMQKEILSLVDGRKTVGIYLNKNHLMNPRKSVTAIMGFTERKEVFDSCKGCILKCESGREHCAKNK